MSIPVNPIDRLPSGDKTKTTKQNYVGIKYGNEKGSISMGHIHEKGDVTSGVMLRTPDGNHMYTMDIDGPRKGWTTLTSPGNVSVRCGMANTESADTLFLEAENGNIVILARNGKIRMFGTDIEMTATGEGGSKGNITINATETIKMDSKKTLITTSAYTKLCGAGTVEIAANSVLNIYGSIFSAIGDSLSQIKKTKFRSKQKQIEQLNTSGSAHSANPLDDPRY